MGGNCRAGTGSLVAECLNAHWFLVLADARGKVEDWRKDYSDYRPHREIGDVLPAAFKAAGSATDPLPK